MLGYVNIASVSSSFYMNDWFVKLLGINEYVALRYVDFYIYLLIYVHVFISDR